MDDFAFGTLSTDALKRYDHQLRRSGIRHDHVISPRKPQPGQPITVFAITGVDLTAEHVACYYTTDGSEPGGSRGVASSGAVAMLAPIEDVWDSFVWGYTTRWSVTLPGLPAGTRLRYRIGAWAGTTDEVFADYPDVKASAEYAAQRHFAENLPPDPTVRWGETTPGTVYSIAIGQPGPPAWAYDAIIYQVLIDRFAPSPGSDWLQTRDLADFVGGTLNGVTSKLDYIAGLGANTLWLSPLFASPSSHGYDASDYRRVQPRYGTDDDLRRLIGEAHDRGLRVMFDLACNHLSSQNPIFQQARDDSASPYRAWFDFDDSEIGYRAFFGVASMPEINLRHPDARDWMIENALYWLREFGIDGYRLDYAQGAGPDFWSYFVDACKRENPASFYFGEIIEAPDTLLPFVGRLDGALDFHVNHMLRRIYAAGQGDAAALQRFLKRHQRYLPDDDFVMPAFLDNHDMDRFLFVAGGDRSRLLAGLEALLALPNPPVLLYGTEVGLSQQASTRTSDLNIVREPMPWGAAQNAELLARTRELIQQRRGAA